MKIGLVMPVSWEPLLPYLPQGVKLPEPLKFEFGSHLAVALRKRGHEVHVFTLCQLFQDEMHVSGDGIHVHIAGYRKGAWRYTLDFYRTESRRLLNMLNAFPCDILHAHWTYEFALPVVKSRFKHVVSMRDAPWKVLWLFTPKSFRFMRLVLAYYVIAKARNILVASPYMAEYCRKWHLWRRRISIIPNAIVNCDAPHESRSTACIDEQSKNNNCNIVKNGPEGTRTNQPVVFAAVSNGFFGCKNVPTLLKAFSLLRQMTSMSCELRLYGWGSEPDGFSSIWARERKLDLGVVFCGKFAHSELLKEVKWRAHVFVHPSLEESFGNVIVEAMSIGLPTIIGKYSGAAAWVAGDGLSGFVVDVRNAREIAQAMKIMAEDEALRKEKSMAALELVRERYQMDLVATQHEQLYCEIIDHNVLHAYALV